MRLTFVSNHDKNAWNGTEFEQFGEALAPAIVLSVVGEGLPLIYNGQEAGNAKRLPFFDKDAIAWRDHPNGDLYRSLFALKKAHTALWNAGWGARMIAVPNSAPAHVFSFVRRNEADRVLAVINFSGVPQAVTFGPGPHHGSYREYFSGEAVTFEAGTRVELEPWGHRVFTS
jgi:glycosidase